MRSILLISLLLPLICLSEILWEDNFDSYYEGMGLAQSPYWEVFFGEDYGIICKYPNGEYGFGVRFRAYDAGYYAKGGSVNSNMKVSVNITDIADTGSCSLGLMTRVNGSNNYMLCCYKDHSSYNIQDAVIFCYYGGKYTLLTSKDINKEIKTISIEAKGKNPVYIIASLDNILISVIDSSFNLGRGYGGMFYSGSCICMPYIVFDNFIEEGEPFDRVSIETTSLGNIKALFK